ncbi:cytochrome d ubiquinol oxidase subunit II [Brevibacterium aurantiacum]|uniref:Cytochrome d ubiquinol oxidase subunit II n=1 Tax=Brevibacterium aurantiacum TaxID=273384 RepID=A0A556CQF7_BREAU|nr:cytochrome d ubiquinol oxidase subunit II [Brevibacterium aurantiacum]TSI19659.1 cytochrome d ubiquinol oxidase subunit II [Brevibacterium aurantiacum]
MPRTTIGLGIVLIVVGVIAYVATSFASWTALIPAILGAVLLICGLIALKNQKLGIHIALVVAILGIFGTGMNVMQVGALIAGEAERPAAVITSIITFVLLIIYVVMGVRSFIAARRWKNSAKPEAAQQ